MSEELLPCPFCGAGETRIDEKHMPPRMSGPGELIAAEVRHWCDRSGGALSRMNVVMAGRTREDVVAAWNCRTRA
jgi:hypothetical protein